MLRPLYPAFVLALASACASTEPAEAPAEARAPVDWAEVPVTTSVSAADLGKPVKLRGKAFNLKLGAVLAVDNEHVWIDGLDWWPDGYYRGGHDAETLTVTGILDEDHGLPVFIQREGAPAIQGIPVPEGTDLEQASRRFVLRDAKW